MESGTVEHSRVRRAILKLDDVVVIPARMGSTRFPGKPLASILGVPMLSWVVRNSVAAVGVSRTFVASCDAEIVDLAKSLGVRGVMTSPSHERATDRTHEAVEILVNEGVSIENVVMLQGDEPTIPPRDIQKAIDALKKNGGNQIVNLMGQILTIEEWENPNTIKVVVGSDSAALYFSRSPIPHGLHSFPAKAHKQVCAIGFTLSALRRFSSLQPDPLEIAESIDMLRWLSAGFPIKMMGTDARTHPVDSPTDVAVVEEILSNSPQNFS